MWNFCWPRFQYGWTTALPMLGITLSPMGLMVQLVIVECSIEWAKLKP